jgi:uncharacterized membrane protein
VTLWHHYWAWTGGNIGAMPLQALITAAVTVLLWPFTRRLIRRLQAESRAETAAALQEAKAARRIAADLFEHHTGRTHPDAPNSGTEAK